MSHPVTLIFTNSKDLTVDRLIEPIGTKHVARPNQGSFAAILNHEPTVSH